MARGTHLTPDYSGPTQGFWVNEPQFKTMAPHFEGCPCERCPELRQTKKGNWRWRKPKKHRHHREG